jgi:hypothetical protein
MDPAAYDPQKMNGQQMVLNPEHQTLGEQGSEINVK